jgi:hypothetical protein
MPLDWQLANFGQTGVDPDGDYNSNGVPNYLELASGVDRSAWPIDDVLPDLA